MLDDVPIEDPQSRLFHAIVLMGCSLATLSGCADTQRPAWLDQQHCTAADLDAGLDLQDACIPTDGWPPTK